MKLWILKNGQNFCRYGDISINGQKCPNKLLLETYVHILYILYTCGTQWVKFRNKSIIFMKHYFSSDFLTEK